jgi:hypothetical protein
MSAILDPSQVGAVEKMIVSAPYADLVGIRSQEIVEDRVRLSFSPDDDGESR